MINNHRYRLLRPFKLIATLTAAFALLAVVCVFIPRLPDQYVCMEVTNFDITREQPKIFLDLIKGLYYVEENPGWIPAFNIPLNPNYEMRLKPSNASADKLDLYVITADQPQGMLIQTGLVQIISARIAINDFHWSHDGSRVAYLWSSDNQQVYLSSTTFDGSHQQSVPYRGGGDFNIPSSELTGNAWSADDAYLLTAEENTTTGYQFWAADDLAPVAFDFGEASLNQGTWSPQGHLFAAVMTAGKERSLVILDPEHPSDIKHIPLSDQTAIYIDWSPDGRYLTLANLLRTCVNNQCEFFWSYDIFAADGHTLKTSILGSRMAPGDNLSRLTGTWALDKPSWVFLQQQTTLDVVSLDAETGQQKTIASDLASVYINDVFMASAYSPTEASHSFKGYIYNIPDGKHLVLPVQKDGKITVEISDLDGGNRTTLLENVDEILRLSDYSLHYLPIQNDQVVARWRVGDIEGLTTARQDGSQRHQTPPEAGNMIYQGEIADNWISYMIWQPDNVSLSIFNTTTGQYHHLIDQIPADKVPFVQLAPDEQQVAVHFDEGGVSSPGQLFIVSLNGEPPRQIDDKAIHAMRWSPDGTLLAYPRNDAVVIVDAEGNTLQKVELPGGSPFGASLEWTKCY